MNTEKDYVENRMKVRPLVVRHFVGSRLLQFVIDLETPWKSTMFFSQQLSFLSHVLAWEDEVIRTRVSTGWPQTWKTWKTQGI